jgi:agmatine/peptidylarginine deiminase
VVAERGMKALVALLLLLSSVTITNGTQKDIPVLAAYGDPADGQAAAVLAQAFPDREIVQVPCRSLIWQNGSLHCITMQLPEGILT